MNEDQLSTIPTIVHKAKSAVGTNMADHLSEAEAIHHIETRNDPIIGQEIVSALAMIGDMMMIGNTISQGLTQIMMATMKNCEIRKSSKIQ